MKTRFRKFVQVDTSGCWLWTGSIQHTGYGTFRIGRRSWKAHRVAFDLFRGTIPEGLSVCHHCDVRHCVNPDHLFLGTNAENIKDKCNKLRQSRKLTPEDVQAIRDDPRPYADICATYNIGIAQVSRIKHKTRWMHLE